MADYKLNIRPDLNPPTIAISQNDIGRSITIYLFGEHQEAYRIPDGATVQFVGTKPSGLGFTVAGSFEGSTVTFSTTEEMSDEAGCFDCEIRITNGQTVIGSANARLFVEENPHPAGTTDGTGPEVVSQITALVNREEDNGRRKNDYFERRPLAVSRRGDDDGKYNNGTMDRSDF